MTQIQSALKSVRASLQKGVELVAVSKTKPVALLLEAYEAGQRDFGENKVQEMALKAATMPEDIRWHMIGHVQTNKIKYMAPFVHLVHGVDREKVLKELDKQAKKVSRIIDCLLQVHIAQEETKFGWSVAELEALLPHMSLYPNVRVRGLMGMASNTDDEHQVRREFLDLNDLYKKHAQAQHWDTLSIGMSGDYSIAMECGATHVRIGSAVFGARNYAP
jgi:PLP dependent protein